MRILVTGGCGFIGSHIVEHHLAKGDHIQVVDDLSTGSLQNIIPFQNNPAFQFEQADISTWPNLKKAVAAADRVYHMAAVVGVYRVISEPLNVLATNIAGTERILKAAAESEHPPRLIIASTSSVYGLSEKPILNEEDALIVSPPDHPLRDYAISKIADEAMARAFFKMQKLPVTLVRLFNTIGPRQTGRYGMVVPRFVQQAYRGETITIYGDGTQTRSFCDVRDVVTALAMLADRTESRGEIVNVGRDSEISINELAEFIRKRANSHSDIIHIPFREAYGEEFSDIKRRRPDLTKLYQLTGFKHDWTLEMTVDQLLSLQAALDL